MALTPRKNEVQAVVALLEQEHADAESLAKALIKLVHELGADRDWHQVIARPFNDNLIFPIGPFATEADAKRAILKSDRIFGITQVHPLLSVTRLTAPLVTQSDTGRCVCGHHEWGHNMKGSQCHARRCACTNFTQEKAA